MLEGLAATTSAIEHHEGETSVTFKRILVVKFGDGLLFPVFEPPVAGNPAIVLVDLAVALPPVIELAPAQADPLNELLGRGRRTRTCVHS